MNVVVTTPTGNIGRRVTQLLIQAGVRPTLIARDPNRIDATIRDLANVVTGDQNDSDFVVRATEGADALFWLNPPEYQSEDPIGGYIRKAANAVRAINENGIQRTVFVSSIGAEHRSGFGLIDGLGQSEALFDAAGAPVVHLRAGFFFTNFLSQLATIRDAGLFFGPIDGDIAFPHVDPNDIAQIAVGRLLGPSWEGAFAQGVYGPTDVSFNEAARVISEATGKEVKFVPVGDDDFRAGLLSNGISEQVATDYVQMFRGLREKPALSVPRSVLATTPTTLGEWAFNTLRPLVTAE